MYFSSTKIRLIVSCFASTLLLFSGNETLLAKHRKREEPKEYIKKALNLFLCRNGKVIVEIGSMRNPLPHPIDSGHCNSCMEGHSTAWWALTGAEVYSIDIAPENTQITSAVCRDFKNVHAITYDGIAFLREFKDPIDLLFLDAWDVNKRSPYAEKHLEAYLTARPRLHANSLILIDDTDIKHGGKGKLVIPQAISDGYHVIFGGRQTLLARLDKLERLLVNQ
jgi:hypothetical protein